MLRASIYYDGVGADKGGNNKEEITSLPVHNGVYRFKKVEEEGPEPEPAVVQVEKEKEPNGVVPKVIEPPVVISLGIKSRDASSSRTAKTETKEEKVSRADADDIGNKAIDIETPRPAETSRLETVVSSEEKESEAEAEKGISLTAAGPVDDNSDAAITKDENLSQPVAEDSETPSLEKPEKVVKEGPVATTVPELTPPEETVPDQATTEAKTVPPVFEESTAVDHPDESKEILSAPEATEPEEAVHLEETKPEEAMAPHAAEPVETGRTGDEQVTDLSPAEVPGIETDEPTKPSRVEEPAEAGVAAEAGPQPEVKEEAAATAEGVAAASKEGMVSSTEQAPEVHNEEPAHVNQAGPVERSLTPPPETALVETNHEGEEAQQQQQIETDDDGDDEDDESAAEAPFIPDHRHTPPSSRKASRGEGGEDLETERLEQEQKKKTAPNSVIVLPDELQPKSPTELTSFEGSVANEEPLMSDEQLNVSDEFRPGVKIDGRD